MTSREGILAAIDHRQPDRALMIVVGCNLFEWGTFLRRMDNFLLDLVAEPATVDTLLDAMMERHMAALERTCRAVGDVADIIRFGDDLGTDVRSPATDTSRRSSSWRRAAQSPAGRRIRDWSLEWFVAEAGEGPEAQQTGSDPQV